MQGVLGRLLFSEPLGQRWMLGVGAILAGTALILAASPSIPDPLLVSVAPPCQKDAALKPVVEDGDVSPAAAAPAAVERMQLRQRPQK